MATNLPRDPQNPPNAPENPQNPAPSPIIGDPMSDDEVERLKQFRSSFLPDARITAQETYAKWLFGLTTTIAALGTGFSNAAFAKLSSLGIASYSLAVIAAGIGIMLAVLTLSEEAKDANWNDFETMNARLTDLMHRKRDLLRWATGCFSASLVFAAASPLLTTIQLRPATPSHGIIVSISGRAVEAGISLEGLRPGAKATLEIHKAAAGKSELVAAFIQIADNSGKISFKASQFALSSEQQEIKAILTYLRGDDPQREEEDFTIPQQAPEAKKDSGSGGTTIKEPVRPASAKTDGDRPKKSAPSHAPAAKRGKCCCCCGSAYGSDIAVLAYSGALNDCIPSDIEEVLMATPLDGTLTGTLSITPPQSVMFCHNPQGGAPIPVRLLRNHPPQNPDPDPNSIGYATYFLVYERACADHDIVEVTAGFWPIQDNFNVLCIIDAHRVVQP